MNFALVAGVSGFLAVAAGAFGAHALRGSMSPELMSVYQTAVLYHLAHTLALLGAAWLTKEHPGWAAQAAGWAFLAGIVLFSGSLYALALSGVRALGAITPLGGVSLLLGWVMLALSAWRA